MRASPTICATCCSVVPETGADTSTRAAVAALVAAAVDAAVAAVRARGVKAVKVPGDISLLARHEEMLDAAEAECGPLH